MPRYALQIEYDGGYFCGWQRQAGQRTVQRSIEVALQVIDPARISIVGSGRTDSGVHALGQVMHCDLERPWAPDKLCAALNSNLRPQPVAALRCAMVDGDFSARFSAIERCYIYRIAIRRAPLSLDAGRFWRLPRMLDCAAMTTASAYLVGRHDFTTFRSAHCQARSAVKTLDDIRIDQCEMQSGHEICLTFRARSFLHRQVRSLVGTLERVGAGMMRPMDVRDALEARDRAACGPVAPAHGLYLSEVRYDPDPFDRHVTCP